MRRVARVLGIFATAGVLACGDHGTGVKPPDQKPESALEFVRFPADLLSSIPSQASFWAVAGQDRKLVLRYPPQAGEEEGEEFLEFEVPGDALVQRADGTPLVQGDSLQITVTLDAEGRFLFHFEPSGLEFDPHHPAKLQVTYRRTAGDLNGDGEVDVQDSSLEQRLSIWKQELSTDPWVQVGSIKIEELDEIEAVIYGFTGFCVAG